MRKEILDEMKDLISCMSDEELKFTIYYIVELLSLNLEE